MDIIFASHNLHKVGEVRDIFRDLDVKIWSLRDLNYLHEIDEVGATFSENSLIKARTIAAFFNKMVIADDSGLEIDALKGNPGIYSARYAGENSTGMMLCQKVLAEMKAFDGAARSCCFTTVMSLVDPQLKVEQFFEGKVQGFITQEMQGSDGFGYDPIFFYPPLAKTMAQMSFSEKNSISHRFRALQKVKEYIKQTYA